MNNGCFCPKWPIRDCGGIPTTTMASASSSVLRARAGSLRQAQAFFARKTPLEKEWAGALRIGAESLTGRAVRMDHTRAGLTGARTMATATLDTSDLPPIPDKRLTSMCHT